MAAQRTMTTLGLVIRATLIAAAAAGCSAPIGCDGDTKTTKPAAPKKAPETTELKIGDKTFKLECALIPRKQFQGLSGRTDIPAEGGMIFVFTDSRERYFVMRDCPIAIDIVFLDADMKITAMHEMTPEPPRADDEKIPAGQEVNQKYEDRLKKYDSKKPAMYVLEFKGGTNKQLSLKEGQKIDIDPDLKKWAR